MRNGVGAFKTALPAMLGGEGNDLTADARGQYESAEQVSCVRGARLWRDSKPAPVKMAPRHARGVQKHKPDRSLLRAVDAYPCRLSMSSRLRFVKNICIPL